MRLPLTHKQKEWVEKTLAGMSLDEKLGQLLCPWIGGLSDEKLKRLFDEVPLGSVFFADWNLTQIRRSARLIGKLGRIPALIAADMDNGTKSGTLFPSALACAAANKPRLMRERGRITGREIRSMGIHWSFAPVADLLLNPQNPELNTRSWGNRAEAVLANLVPLIRGMQEDSRIAATAKHFPGIGADDRDQHLCTAINPLGRREWMESYGRVWRGAIEAGVMSVMTGHIALPHFQNKASDPWSALPATLSPELQRDLLRGELGFEGVIVSDANVMVGIASRVSADEMVVRNILSGGDVFLFGDPRQEFGRLKKAVSERRLSEDRVVESVRRVLEMKARLGLHEGRTEPEPTPAERRKGAAVARELAERSITILRRDASLPLRLKRGASVLTVTVKNKFPREPHRCPPLDIVDRELSRRGFKVRRLETPTHKRLMRELERCDAVFVNLQQPMHSVIGTTRLVNHMAMVFWEGWWVGRKNIVFTSFGSAFHLYEFPHWPNMVLAYDAGEHAQRAAVEVWLGERRAAGTLHAAMPGDAGPCINVREE